MHRILYKTSDFFDMKVSNKKIACVFTVVLANLTNLANRTEANRTKTNRSEANRIT